MNIEGFNANNNYNPITINVVDTELSQIRAISTTEQTVNDVSFRKTTDTANSVEIAISSRTSINMAVISDALARAGLYLHGIGTAFTSETLALNETITLSNYHGTISSYYYIFKHDNNVGYEATFHGLNYETSIYAGTAGSYQNSYVAPIIAKSGDKFYYGVIGYREDNSTIKVIGSIKINLTVNSDSYIEPDYDPGQKGFKPTGAYTNKDNPGNGGRGTTQKKHPDYAADNITQPGAPDESIASAIGSGFINCYKIDSSNLEKVGQCLYGSTMLGFLQSLAVNPLDFIISLMVFPCSPNVGASEHIKLGGWLAAATGGAALGFDASGYKLANEFKVVDFGTLTIPENWGNFLDFSQTTIELYLPFIGSVNIDTSEVMGGTINIQYTIDFFTGMCVANVLCSRPDLVLPSGKPLNYVHAQHSYQGNCAIQIPLSAINYGSMVGSLINACTQGITNPVAGFAGIASDAVAGGFRPNVTSKGNIVANAGFCSVLYPYVRITRPITAEPDSYQEVMGLPSYINTTLAQCEDLCVCDDIDLRGIAGATENELNKIRQMCKDGVYV